MMVATTEPGARPTYLKQTSRGFRAVATDHNPMPAAQRAQRWELCRCESEEKHDRGCPVHLAWVTSWAAQKGAPDLLGLSHNATDCFLAAWIGNQQYRCGARKQAYAPGRAMLANMLGAQHAITRRRAHAENQRGDCAFETVSRAWRELRDARCVESGRRIVRIVRRPKPLTALLIVEGWVLDLPRDATLRVALPGDFDYPDPLRPSTFEGSVRDDSSDHTHQEIWNLLDVGADRKTPPGDLTTQWGEAATFDLVVTFLAGPWMREARDELSTGGRGLAQWFRNQCVRWEKKGKRVADVRRALYACLSYVGTGNVRKGWCPLICAAVENRWSAKAAEFDQVEWFDYFQRSAIAGVRATMKGAEPRELPEIQQEGYREVLRWMTDAGRATTAEDLAVRERAGLATRQADHSEGRTI